MPREDSDFEDRPGREETPEQPGTPGVTPAPAPAPNPNEGTWEALDWKVPQRSNIIVNQPSELAEREVKNLQPAEGGGGGGGGGRATAQPGFNVQTSEGKGESIEDLIEKNYRALISGEGGSYTKERAEMEKQILWETERGKETSQIRQSEEDLIRRGIFRSGLAHKSRREIMFETARRISEGERQIRMAKVMAEFEDKMKGLDMAQKALDSRRQYELGKEQIAAQREATAASYAVGMAQVEASKESARMSAGAAGARLGFDREQFEFQKQQYQEQKDQLGGMTPFTANYMMQWAGGGEG